MHSKILGIFLVKLLLAMPISAFAFSLPENYEGPVLPLNSSDKVRFIYAPFTQHFSKSEDHKYVWLFGAERETPNHRLAGITFFSNSFGQPATYIYPIGGVFRDIFNVNGLYAKWSAGLIYGYKEPHEDSVPFNYDGLSPGFIPAIGYQGRLIDAQLNILNDAGLMIQLNFPIQIR